MNDAVERAVRSSFLAGMSEKALASVMQHAIVLDVPRSSVLYRSGDAPRFAVVVDGLVRVYLGEPGGTRQITVRYARPWAALGATLLGTAGPPPWLELGAQTLAASRLVFFDVRTLRARSSTVGAAPPGRCERGGRRRTPGRVCDAPGTGRRGWHGAPGGHAHA